MTAQPYLFFGGRCAEALDFYREALGADIRAMVRFRDMPGAVPDAGNRVMHAEFGLGDSTILASDGRDDVRESAGYAIALQVADDVEAERLFAVLSADGRIDVPLMTTPFASRFGIATDRFG